LLARVRITDQRVTWSAFEQPYRAERDYTALGPFVFELASYERALSALAPHRNSAPP
jgi:hypothetical protein